MVYKSSICAFTLLLLLSLPVLAQETTDSSYHQEMTGYDRLCKEYFQKNETDHALENGLKAISMCQASNYASRDILNSYNLVALIYKNNKKEFSTAIPYLNKSLLIYQMSNDPKGEAMTLSNLGSTYEQMNNYKVGLEYRLKCVEKCKTFQTDPSLMEYNYHAIMEDYKKLNMKKEAGEYEKLYKAAGRAKK